MSWRHRGDPFAGDIGDGNATKIIAVDGPWILTVGEGQADVGAATVNPAVLSRFAEPLVISDC
jgi:hypothetical protein